MPDLELNVANMDQKKEDKVMARLQVSMFQTLFNLRKDDIGIDMAFASSIADSSDYVFQEAFKKRPELVKEWMKIYGKKKINDRYRR